MFSFDCTQRNFDDFLTVFGRFFLTGVYLLLRRTLIRFVDRFLPSACELRSDASWVISYVERRKRVISIGLFFGEGQITFSTPIACFFHPSFTCI